MTAYDVAARVLQLVTAGLQAAGVDLPTRRYVALGALPAWDAEQLTVAITRPSVPGSPGRERAAASTCSGPRFVEVRVELVRCLPVGDGDEPPTPAELDRAALRLSVEADHLRRTLDDPVAVTGRRGPSSLVGPFVITGPDGGMVGTSALLQVAL